MEGAELFGERGRWGWGGGWGEKGKEKNGVFVLVFFFYSEPPLLVCEPQK